MNTAVNIENLNKMIFNAIMSAPNKTLIDKDKAFISADHDDTYAIQVNIDPHIAEEEDQWGDIHKFLDDVKIESVNIVFYNESGEIVTPVAISDTDTRRVKGMVIDEFGLEEY